jgi:hypothetical protein
MLNKEQKLSQVQREILVGTLLGDAHLERPCRLKVEQGEKHKAYVLHLFDAFHNFIKASEIRRREVRLGEKVHINWCFQTVHHSSFLFYLHQFYQTKKRVPPMIHRLLTPRALAYWYMDDGSIKSKQSKGVIFNTQGFSYKDICTLCEVLKTKFQLDCWPRKQKHNQWQIYVSGYSYERLRELLYIYLIPEMTYKFPSPRIRGLRLTKLPKE